MFWRKKLKKPDEEKQKQLSDEIEKEGGLTFKDKFAMSFSAILVIVPVCLGVLLFIYFMARLFFRI